MKSILECEQRLPRDIEDTLGIIIEKLAGLKFAVTGITTLFLHGMETAVDDIDIQTTADDVYEIERRLAGSASIVIPTFFRKSERISSHYGKLSNGGVEIELMGAVQHWRPAVGWDNAPDLESITERIRYKEMIIPVTSLLHEQRAYDEIGRPDKAGLIRQFLDRS